MQHRVVLVEVLLREVEKVAPIHVVERLIVVDWASIELKPAKEYPRQVQGHIPPKVARKLRIGLHRVYTYSWHFL